MRDDIEMLCQDAQMGFDPTTVGGQLASLPVGLAREIGGVPVRRIAGAPLLPTAYDVDGESTITIIGAIEIIRQRHIARWTAEDGTRTRSRSR